jgi:hypothetical protein
MADEVTKAPKVQAVKRKSVRVQFTAYSDEWDIVLRYATGDETFGRPESSTWAARMLFLFGVEYCRRNGIAAAWAEYQRMKGLDKRRAEIRAQSDQAALERLRNGLKLVPSGPDSAA